MTYPDKPYKIIEVEPKRVLVQKDAPAAPVQPRPAPARLERVLPDQPAKLLEREPERV